MDERWLVGARCWLPALMPPVGPLSANGGADRGSATGPAGGTFGRHAGGAEFPTWPHPDLGQGWASMAAAVLARMLTISRTRSRRYRMDGSETEIAADVVLLRRSATPIAEIPGSLWSGFSA